MNILQASGSLAAVTVALVFAGVGHHKLHSFPLQSEGWSGNPRRPSLPGDDQEVWRLDPNPVLTIGVIEGPDEYVFQNVHNAAVFSDGSVAVTQFNRGLFDIRFYDSEGRFLTSVGRYGPGPFELNSAPMSSSRIPGDSLLLIGQDTRYFVVGPRGEKGRTGRLPLQGLYRFAYSLGNDHLVVENLVLERPTVKGENIYWSVFVSVDLNTEAVDTIATLPAQQLWYDARGRGADVPFSLASQAEAGNGRLWYGVSTDPKIRSYRPGDTSVVEIELSWTPAPVTKAMERGYEEFIRERDGDDRDQIWYLGRNGPDFPESLPLYQHLEVDNDGDVWVLTYGLQWSEEDFVWQIMSPEGTHLATLAIPFEIAGSCVRRGFRGCSRFLEVDKDYILMEVRDELGVQQVKKYKVLRGNGGQAAEMLAGKDISAPYRQEPIRRRNSAVRHRTPDASE